MPRISIENLTDIDATDGYVLSDEGEDAGGDYYGYLNSEGQWYIMYYPWDAETQFVKGDSGYVASWLARTTLTYADYDAVW